MSKSNDNKDYGKLDEEFQDKYPEFNFGYHVDQEITKIFYDKNMNRWEIRNRMTTPDFVYSCQGRVCLTEYENKPDVCLECGFTIIFPYDIWG